MVHWGEHVLHYIMTNVVNSPTFTFISIKLAVGFRILLDLKIAQPVFSDIIWHVDE